MGKLYNLAYISKNTINGTPETVKDEIAVILAAAHKNNPSMEITGALLYSGGYFCQVIEGPEETIEDLFETIQMDDRHGSVTVLHFEPIEKRGFSEWAMALAGIEDTMRFNLEGVLDSKDKIRTEAAGRDLVSTLEKLMLQHQSVLGDPAN